MIQELYSSYKEPELSYKKSDPLQLNNNRPITLLNIDTMHKG